MKEEPTLKNFPFPEGPNNGDVYFHGELACEYHSESNTWECWRYNKEDRN